MKILLIVAGSFAPSNVIGAIRWTKIAKYLSKKGISVSVIAQKNHIITADEILIQDASYCDKVQYVSVDFIEKVIERIYRIYEKLISITGKKNDKQFQQLMHTNRWLRLIGYIGFYKQAKRLLKHDSSVYDIIISTNPICAHWTAMYASKKYKIPWIADFRDPIAQTPPEKSPYNCWMHKWQSRICKKADSVIAVSNGLKDVLCGSHYNLQAKTHVIYNGYDPEEINNNNQLDSGIIRLVYTGILYSGKRDLSPVFEAISNLCNRQKMKREDIEFVYAGNEFLLLQEQAKKYGLESILIDKGFVPRKEALFIQTTSDILVLATYNDEGNPGVMPGKLYEYMMMQKPILAVVSGSAQGSELKEVINKTSVGYCHETNFDEIVKLEAFIMSVVDAKIKQDSLPYKFFTQDFEYSHIAEEIEELIQQTIKNTQSSGVRKSVYEV